VRNQTLHFLGFGSDVVTQIDKVSHHTDVMDCDRTCCAKCHHRQRCDWRPPGHPFWWSLHKKQWM